MHWDSNEDSGETSGEVVGLVDNKSVLAAEIALDGETSTGGVEEELQREFVSPVVYRYQHVVHSEIFS